MQENEFEKQVKIKMDELSFSPSAPVWEAIKKQVEKKKRRILPFIFLLIIIATSGSYYMYINVNSNFKKQNKNYTALKRERLLTSQDEQKNNNQPGQSKSTFQGLNKYHSALIKDKHRYNSNKFPASNSKDNQLLNQNKLTVNQNANRIYFQKSQTTTSSQDLIEKNNVSATTNTLVYNNQILNVDSLKQKDNNFNQSNNLTENSNSTTSAIKEKPLVENSDSITQTHSTKSNKKQILNNNQPAKWQWEITAMYGKSNLVNNFNLSNSNSKPYQPASAYSFGVIINRKVFKNGYLNSGLAYAHLSTKSYTARSADYSLIAVPFPFGIGSNNGNYLPETEKTYTNKYNFIELPVSLQYKLFHIKQFAVSYNVGVSVMQLINAKSLIYDSRRDVYLNDTSNLRRTQFQILSGLNFQFNTKNNGSFLLGPHVEYSLSNFVKTNNLDRRHFMQFGLQATWLFNKK